MPSLPTQVASISNKLEQGRKAQKNPISKEMGFFIIFFKLKIKRLHRLKILQIFFYKKNLKSN